MTNLLQWLKETPHLTLNLGSLKIPYGAIAFSDGMMLGIAQAQGVDLGGLEMSFGLLSVSVIGAARAGMGTTNGHPLATIVNYVDPKQHLPTTENERKDYNSLENIGKRCATVGFRYQIETLLGYGVGYLYGKLQQ